MPFLDWVNKTQAAISAAEVPYHLLHCESLHGDISPLALCERGPVVRATHDNLKGTDLLHVAANA
ncbi:MAG: hypothetical protein V1782_01785 [Pseudomonadota bacterium]